MSGFAIAGLFVVLIAVTLAFNVAAVWIGADYIAGYDLSFNQCLGLGFILGCAQSGLSSSITTERNA